MRATIAIEIEAPPELVFALARDVLRWPSLLPHYVGVAAESRHGSRLVARFIARRQLIPALGIGLPVAWRARTWSEPAERRIRFVHLGGATAGMEVTWRIEPSAFGSDVSIEHVFEPRIAVWAPLLDRLFVRPIAGRTLATFKAIAEALAASGQTAEVAG